MARVRSRKKLLSYRRPAASSQARSSGRRANTNTPWKTTTAARKIRPSSSRTDESRQIEGSLQYRGDALFGWRSALSAAILLGLKHCHSAGAERSRPSEESAFVRRSRVHDCRSLAALGMTIRVGG